MFYTVYQLTNLINDKIYIGVHQTEDLEDGYMGSGKLIKRAVAKYGAESFRKDYLAIFANAEDMYQMEAELVTRDFVAQKHVYNLKEGGNGGFGYLNSETGIDRRRESIDAWIKMGADKAKEMFHSDPDYRDRLIAHLARISKKGRDATIAAGGSFLGKKHTDETKQKMREAKRGLYAGEKNPHYGSVWIHSLVEKETKRIPKDDLSMWVQRGWIKGRKMKF